MIYAALARRLVTGALGVRLSTAREEREIERRVLKEAKGKLQIIIETDDKLIDSSFFSIHTERKLLAAKMRDEAWEN